MSDTGAADPFAADPADDALPGHSPAQPLNRLAVVSLVTAFILPLVATVLAHLALRQLRSTGERGQSLALTAAVIGYLVTIIGVIVIAQYVVGLTGMPGA
jgi:hypothetical protein